ncbi:MAG: ATP-binding protein [Gammaproteobacteria bacterium]|nr:ATP-binding protein [Gammaproteobacteria bacterium]MDH5593263.1 ATP-binding protein [Gammaproteobacteria bacterium]MDH5614264.1 ATP-binding protein [Gammaproteobacteria bacterium]
MAADKLKQFSTSFKPVSLLFVGLIVLLYLMSAATENSAQFGRMYSIMLMVAVFGLVILLGLITFNLTQLIRRYRKRVMGSRMTLRLVTMFIILSLLPVSVVYYFSLQFLHRGIDSWFDVRVDHAMEDAMELSRTALDVRMRQLLRDTKEMANELSGQPLGMISVTLNDLRSRNNASELTLMSLNGKIIASNSIDTGDFIPDRPDEAILLQLKQGLSYAGLDPIKDAQLNIRVVITVPATEPTAETLILQALYPVSEHLGTLADSVQTAYAQYAELSYLRSPLIYSFTLILSLILLLGVLTAVLSAIFVAQRLVSPIQQLAEGTRAVADGDYDKRIPLPGTDEMGLLIFSFNQMTHRISQARDTETKSKQLVEKQRAFLEGVLSKLSSGVLTINTKQQLQTANPVSGKILDIDMEKFMGKDIAQISKQNPHLENFIERIKHHLEIAEKDWREEIHIFGNEGRKVIMCRGALLSTEEDSGQVIVFDDVTVMMQAQSDKAWSEVARRLAHEIKNPLTPIQLSAERLRHKYLDTMPAEDAEVMDRATHTIVQQVDVMKEMVKAFSEYARSPQIRLIPVDLPKLINEVLELYRNNTNNTEINMTLESETINIEADAGRLRQLIHNLLKNAMEASVDKGHPVINISSRQIVRENDHFIELRVADNGPGIPEKILPNVFEPYVTTKTKGTGLGLAIVKKIVEEHNGVLWAENNKGGGACIVIRFPVHEIKQIPSSDEQKVETNA